MAMLHIVNKSPFEKVTFESCLNHVSAGDSVLMIEDAAVGAVDGTAFADELKSAMTKVNVYVLAGDLTARGLSEDRLIDGINTVDYAGFVDLTTGNETIQSWL
ncbi:MAG TPA: sulfurtransferase complex subunit TusB [Leucothrix mucor]|uniref:Sulfurtransferase complex subunit TusB n=1 Tax=Leucothrix mucor TaxID=45248 RepID=A0A7V2T4I7_LEUMU|nr:sulfurtransferase complex subunit TusB [Leucothrix mucor]